MVKLQEMSREELLEVIKMKDEIIKELRDEVEAYRALVDELQSRLGMKESNFSGYGD